MMKYEFLFAFSLGILFQWIRSQKKKNDDGKVVDGAVGLIGNTPIVHLRVLSSMIGCQVYAKCEFMNPGGSSKDRVALQIIKQMKECGYPPGSKIFEGTVGSTGISLAWISKCFGYKAHICMPDDQAKEKYDILEKLGAEITKVRPCSIIDSNHFVNVARRKAKEEGGMFADQFENEQNFKVHYETTGPEIYRQMMGDFDHLVLGAGTGGTMSGCSHYLKEKMPNLRVIAADPQGSGLYNKVRSGVFFNITEAEGKRKRHQVDTVVEGVGVNRMTRNLEFLFDDHPDQMINMIDDSIRVSDREVALMAMFMVEHEGLFLGSSSCVNLVACVKLSRRSQGSKIVTMFPDAGFRHLTKFWNQEYLISNGILTEKDLKQGVIKDLDFIDD